MKINHSTPVLSLSKKWSARANRLILALSKVNRTSPKELTISEFYWWHWSNMGMDRQHGFRSTWIDDKTNVTAGIGMRTYEEIRNVFTSNGLPDLSDEMFSPPGFCSKCCPKELLDTTLDNWTETSKIGRRRLRQGIFHRYCDGH